MNTVQILGNLARDPEVRYTQSGRAVATFTVAATNTYIDSTTNETKEQTAFVNCVAWGKLGEAVGNYRKGNRLFVEGRIQTRSYEDSNGQKKYVMEVIAGFVGVSALNDTATESNFENFADDKGNDENVPF
ncbi:MAG: single-stranded DNA-binding protein [Veillonella sp.]|jgi:single-strand binding protein|uniref:single-stranded DNA-binding protein n=1 Tax=Veillonella sp. TaxID=1926307 RepID=UPI00204A1530|nr:single-stranded DNA-binding protein [Veillonella sp.]MBS5407424.1 single-stranded DNA-binding protein [Veillonella sp.]DAR15566.1 MAG TPA: Single strand binding protein [Caudoviricetes sp.]